MKDDNLYLIHMLELARKVRRHVRGKTRDDFDRDEMFQLALTHLIQTIGEAARHVSKEYQAAHPAIPWNNIVGMRHKVVHDYIRIDLTVVWQTATENIHPLITELESLLPPELWKYLEDDSSESI